MSTQSAIAVSPDSRHPVTGGEDRTSIRNRASSIFEDVDHHQNGVFMYLSKKTQEVWLRGELESAMERLSRDIVLDGNSYYAFANRALVQARLKKWDNALADSKMSLDIQPSIIGCIAKSIALSGQGGSEDSMHRYEVSMQAFDLAFSYCGEQMNYLLLIKSVVLFLAGWHRHAITRTSDLIEILPGKPSHCNVVQAQMSFLLAKSAFESHDYSSAIQLLTPVRLPGEFSQLPELLTISLITGWNFNTLRFEVHRIKCEALFAAGLTDKAVASFLEADCGAETKSKSEMEWISDFGMRCVNTRLAELGDVAVDASARLDDTSGYSQLVSRLTNELISQSKAYVEMGDWEAALRDANSAIELDSSCPGGYEGKCAALHCADRYDEAIKTLNAMYSKFGQSPGCHIHGPGRHNHYLEPSKTTKIVCESASRYIQPNSPLILIDTESGRLCDQKQRIRTFEADQKFKQLISSTASQIDNGAIDQVVREFFRYATFSHTWVEGNEPLYRDILTRSLHEFKDSPKFEKVLKFCAIVKDEGFRWAWSDTCCIDQSVDAVLQRSLISMFRWYEGSSLTIVHLMGVLSYSELVTLVGSHWITRAWTLQEFLASKNIRFYTGDWQLYRHHKDTCNHEDTLSHKQCSVIMQEVQCATGISVDELRSLHSTSKNNWQKLHLASTRFSKEPEDIAYSLFGIFNVSIPVRYGEGESLAVERLLQEVFAKSRDVTILAWTGKASTNRSYFPVDIRVYSKPLSLNLPSSIPDDKMETLLSELPSTMSHDAEMLYEQLDNLPKPRIDGLHLSLSCIMFPLKNIQGPYACRNGSPPPVYYAKSSILGNIKIRTSDNLARQSNLVLVHPWFRSLFDFVPPHQDRIANDRESSTHHTISDRGSLISDGNSERTLSSHAVQALQPPCLLNKTTRALRLFARLRQPFEALLLMPVPPKEYKRIAADNPILVSIRKDVPPRDLLDKTLTVDIL